MFETKEEDSLHSKTQDTLIKLGKITGCQIWIASNDRNRLFQGKSLGEACLKSLPNLGLNEEAKNRISLIDVIWIRQNSPICAFEIETTTSIYSGLLRMSDLQKVKGFEGHVQSSIVDAIAVELAGELENALE